MNFNEDLSHFYANSKLTIKAYLAPIDFKIQHHNFRKVSETLSKDRERKKAKGTILPERLYINIQSGLSRNYKYILKGTSVPRLVGLSAGHFIYFSFTHAKQKLRPVFIRLVDVWELNRELYIAYFATERCTLPIVLAGLRNNMCSLWTRKH